MTSPLKVIRKFDPIAALGGMLILASLVVMGWMVSAANEKDPLSQLEVTLFSVLLFVLGMGGTVLVTAYYSRRQGREEYGHLARPALRRVVQLGRSADQIAEAIRSKQLSLASEKRPSLDNVEEWLDSFGRLLSQHSGQLDDAISDWRELLPAEYEELVETNRLRKEYDNKLVELQQRQVELKETQADQAGEARKSEEALLTEVERLKQEVNQLGLKLDRKSVSFGGSILDSPGISWSGSSLVLSSPKEGGLQWVTPTPSSVFNIPRLPKPADKAPKPEESEKTE